MKKVAVVIPAGGAGRRMGGTVKPLLELCGRPILQRTIEPFLARADVRWVIVALPAEQAAQPPSWLLQDARVAVVAGGAERGDSVRAALDAVPRDADIVLVHDAARPLVSATIIDRCVNAAADGRCAIAGVPVTDTIQEVDEAGQIAATPDRAMLRAAQTPQAFPASVLREAYARAASAGVIATDDAALVARLGVPVMVVEGSPHNIKITTPTDLVLAEALIAARK